MQHDNVSALAAGTAFYALTSIFPTLTAVVSVYGLIVDPAMVERQVDAMTGLLPPEAIKLVATWLQALVQGPPARFGIGLLVSVLLACWSVWSATVMLMTAVNTCYGAEETRGFVRFNLEALALGTGLVLLGVAAFALVAILPILLSFLPIPAALQSVISLSRWPILAGLGLLVLAIVYRFAPARRLGHWALISWGAAIATVLWLIGSVGFSYYVSAFGSYDRTYGSLGAVVVLLLWFYITAYTILIGAEVNAEVERQRTLSAASQSATLAALGGRQDPAVETAEGPQIAQRREPAFNLRR
jgi:membrane protein